MTYEAFGPLRRSFMVLRLGGMVIPDTGYAWSGEFVVLEMVSPWRMDRRPETCIRFETESA